jgi:hypothetical protein
MWANFQCIIELFIPKIVTKLSKIWVWDPEKTYPGSRGQKGTGSGSATQASPKGTKTFTEVYIRKYVIYLKRERER